MVGVRGRILRLVDRVGIGLPLEGGGQYLEGSRGGAVTESGVGGGGVGSEVRSKGWKVKVCIRVAVRSRVTTKGG